MNKIGHLYRIRWTRIYLLLLALDVVRACADSPLNWEYTLTSGTTLLDDCPICERPGVPWPMRGRFRLQLVDESTLYTDYAIEEVAFTSTRSSGAPYKVTGHGKLRIGGEVAITRKLSMDLYIDDGVTNKACTFTNDISAPSDRLWPMQALNPVQSDGTWTRLYQLNVAAAPLNEIWFSTTGGFHPGIGPWAQSAISGGDLISMSGRIVARNSRFSAHLGIMPVVPDLGLNSLAIGPGGELVFSIEQDAFSETIGPIYIGDILSDHGRVFQDYKKLFAPFNSVPPVPNVGLDALFIAGTNGVYFSVTQDFISTTSKGKVVIHHGDLLSSGGKVLKTNAELLSRFNPQPPQNDYGLDSIWVWPSGEIWFSTTTGFMGPNFEQYGPGDLLSDEGYVVFANLEMLGAFAPLEDRSQFGLDSLFIVSDATPVNPPPQITGITRDPNSGAVTLQWNGNGQVFQVLRSNNADGPYLPISDILPDLAFLDESTPSTGAFYQVAQW